MSNSTRVKVTESGGSIETVVYPGAPHGFMTFDAENPSFEAAVGGLAADDAPFWMRWVMTSSDFDPEVLARFANQIGNLQTNAADGWIDRGIPVDQVESVADHSFRVAALAWIASAQEPGLDRDRVVKLALLHDMAEAVIGDLLPYEPESLEGLETGNERCCSISATSGREARSVEKRQLKSDALELLVEQFPDQQRSELESLWRELEERQSPEARFVKQIDVLETYLQSREYAAV